MKSKTLERAMEFLACPRDKKRLREFGVRVGRNGFVRSGSLKCDSCGENYPILDGVPFFYNGRENKSINTITLVDGGRQNLRDSLDMRDEKECIRVLSGIATNLIEISSIEPLRRILSIKSLECIVEEFEKSGLDEDQSLMLRQAFNVVRYNLEDYRGTFVVPPAVLSELSVCRGLVFEAGCATGENLQAVRQFFEQGYGQWAYNIGFRQFTEPRPIYIGLDISESLIMEADKRFGSENTIFVQGNVTTLPIAGNSTSLYMANNIWDRVGSPRTAAAEAKRVLAERGVIEVGNCAPLQYESPEGKVVYVPESQRASLREVVELAGARIERSITGLVWNISTLLYGEERLAVDLEIGRKIERSVM